MRYYYEINRRKVAGLETSYEEWVVSFQDETGREVERVAAFMHEACADGLRNQLQRAFEHGIATVPQAQPSPSAKLRDPARCTGDGCEGCGACWQGDWEASIADAHESLNRLEDVALRSMAESFEAEEAELPTTHRAPYVDIKGNDGGTTRVHLLADSEPEIPHMRVPESSKRRDTRPGLGKRTFLPPHDEAKKWAPNEPNHREPKDE